MRLFLIIFGACFCFTAQIQASVPFNGRVKGNGINIRADSTVTAEKICAVNSGDFLEITAQLYEWYKVKLPKNAPAFVRADLLELIDTQTAKVSKKNINIRLRPTESAPIIGKAEQNEIVHISEPQNGWYKIEPTNNSFGWINKTFVEKASIPPPNIMPVVQAQDNQAQNDTIVVYGILKPKIIKSVATHKLIADTGEIFLLRNQPREILNALNHRNVKITGRKLDRDSETLPFLEIHKIEALD